MIRLFRKRRRRSARLIATGPAAVYSARAGAYRPLRAAIRRHHR